MITDINECLSLSHSKLLVLIIHTPDLYVSLSIACEGQSRRADAEARRRVGRRRGRARAEASRDQVFFAYVNKLPNGL